ncbi:MAG: aspartyl/asparaginyl beta-hydroxylase domain-containing protein [Alphaproteobacteria bacterium]|nr:aspartyl/asparaginyl beta-hydroxylase domain-containing protein [Alphaproteobacteria bacterium]
MAVRIGKKKVKQAIIAALFLAVTLTFIPAITVVYIACGLLDVIRNERRDFYLFQRYFSGNGFTTWLVAPLNLLLDLVSYRNRKIYRPEDFSEECQAELETVLSFFRDNKDAVIRRIDGELGTEAKRGMFLFRWFGQRYNRDFAPLNGDFRHIRTIAVSVFQGTERTNFHFGPLRLTLRVLYNLTPVKDAEVFIECGRTKHYWADDPLFIFDDTLMHRSVNDHDGRRYVVFMDVIRPSPVPALLRALMVPVSWAATAFKSIYYRRWTMLGTGKAPAE